MSIGFGKRLKELRNESMLKQSDIAKALDVHDTTVTKWESGTNEPCLSDLKKLAKILNISLDILLDYDDNL